MADDKDKDLHSGWQVSHEFGAERISVDITNILLDTLLLF